MKKYIYLLSTFGIDKNTFELIHPRTVGILKSLRDAKKVVKYNICDICECNYYRVALIEKIQLGMYNSVYPTTKWWYDIKTTKKKINGKYKYYYQSEQITDENIYTKWLQNDSYNKYLVNCFDAIFTPIGF